MSTDQFYTLDHGSDGIAVLTWDLAGNAVNVWTEAGLQAFESTVSELVGDPSVRGVVIASAKPVFHVGADLSMVGEMRARTPERGFSDTMRYNAVFRLMETGGTPFAAAIDGHALGGGLELALACHARFVRDTPKIQLGLPEVKLGLVPGFGGTQRLPRLMPLMKAMPLLAQGGSLRPEAADAAGLVTQRIASGEGLVDAARQWLLENPDAKQPWDVKGYRLPSGAVHGPAGFQFFIGASGQGRKATHGNYPAPRLILESVYHGLQMPFDQGVKFATRRFIEAVHSDVSHAMIDTLFFGMNAANALERRPDGPDARSVTSIGMIGAGLMGAGIAYQASKSGLSVVLLDRDADAAARGKAYTAKLLDKAVSRGRMSRDAADAQLARITPTTDYAELAEVDLVVEAVFESKPVKEEVLGRVSKAVRSDAIIASNTSTIPITELAAYVDHPERFIGLHFFSPVDKMQLVEIISGDATSKATLAAAFDFVGAIRKTPIDVNDGRAFYTTRVVSSYMVEGMALLREGVRPALIENAGKLAGMPMGPLRLADMVALDLAVKIADQNRADLGEAYVEHPGIPAARHLVGLGRTGEGAQAGFYDYGQGDPTLWAGLAEAFPVAETQPGLEAVQERLMTIQALEALRCFDDGVLKSVADADIGSILGWGFPPFTGGIAHYIDARGGDALHAAAQVLHASVGERFAPPEILSKMAETGEPLSAVAA